ncbi:MAG: HMA2 domain-containing protein [Candidatus Xenobia bacterium]
MLDGLQGEVLHAIPGRVRMRVQGLKGNEAVARRLERELAALAGVQVVVANPNTGTLLMQYDPQEMSPARFGDVRRLRFNSEVPHAAPSGSKVADQVTDAFNGIDSGIERISGGFLNLRTLIPLTFLGFAIKRIIVDGNIEAVPVHALLWYSYSTFHNMHLQLQMKERFANQKGGTP